MQLVILDYGSGNLRSVEQAVRRAVSDLAVDTNKPEISVSVVQDAEAVARADYISLPGVGHFADCWAGLNKIAGMAAMLEEQVRQKAKPFLGICVGMQLMASRGFEGVETPGFGWIDGDVVPLEGGHDATGQALKIPHMGWNQLQINKPDHPIAKGLDNSDYMYFVHSYHMQLRAADALVANSRYGHDVTALVAKDNMVGTQFHPEKSQRTGQVILKNFLGWRP